jgi:hypothetical protein
VPEQTSSASAHRSQVAILPSRELGPSGGGFTVFGVTVFRAPWSGASFLVYLGGLTILSALGSLLSVQASHYGSGGFVAWALLIFAVVTGLALLARRHGYRITAGLLALSSVAAVVTLLGAALDWLGWLADINATSPFAGFHVSLLVLEFAVVAASAVAVRVFSFPLLVLPLTAGAWLFATDLLSSGGDWSAAVTLLFGLALLAVAVALDQGGATPYAFWAHVVAGLTIGGGLLWFFHSGDWDWVLVAIAGALYIAAGDRLARSSWIVLGAWGALQTAAHFAAKWTDIVASLFPLFYLFPFVLASAFGETGPRTAHPWASALVFALTGAIFVAVGQLIATRRGRVAAL